MASNKEPWDLVIEHRYDEALARYRDLAPSRANRDYVPVAEEATALLCLGQLSAALDRFREANAIATEVVGGEDRPYAKKIGAVQWLLGDRDAAVVTWYTAVQQISKGETKFADNAGGVTEGLLLWYGGVTATNVIARDYALEYLAKLAKKTRIKYWPGPIAELALGRKSFQEVLQGYWATDDSLSLTEKAESDLLIRREFSQALFYFATKERSDGHESTCLKWMQHCAQLSNPVLEIEWYLARGETCPK